MDFSIVRSALQKKGYKVSCFESAPDASAYLNQVIDGKSVGFGGSETVKEMGLYTTLGAHNIVLGREHHTAGADPKVVRELASQTQIYIMSANGVAMTGEIVNIDAIGNRVASALYGHDKVYFIIGANKIEADCGAAIFRARNVAAPLNAKRMHKKTPCAEKGDKCYDCQSPERICRALTVLWEKPEGCEYEVVLINEKLGL